MPFRRARSETKGKALEEIAGERDLREKDEHLPAGFDRRGDGLEIDLGLARTGDAVEERDRIAADRDRLAEHRGRRGLLGG